MTVMNDAAVEIVARNVRSARAAAGLSLDALAARAEVSKGALVGLEGARGNPNLGTLVRLGEPAGWSVPSVVRRADAVGWSVSSLMEDARPDEDPVVVVDAGEVAPLWTGPAGGTARLMLTNPRPAPVEVWRWLLHPGERHDSAAHAAGTTETLTVVRGQLRLVVGAGGGGEAERVLRAGATAAF